MLSTIVSSETRVKLLIRFFFCRGVKSYLQELEREYGESRHTIRRELLNLEKAGLLRSDISGNRRYYRANTGHPFYGEIVSLVRKSAGIDHIISNVISRAGAIESAWITGTFARGIDSETIELVLSGPGINTSYINQLVKKAEKILNRKIIYVAFTPEQAEHFLKERESLLIWAAE
jgi:DNA-binding transcriptional ArsR family regulator